MVSDVKERQKSRVNAIKPGKKDYLRERKYVVTSKKKDVECIKDEVHLERLTKDETAEIVSQIKYYVDATQNARGVAYGDTTREARAKIVLELFQFMSSPKSIRFMKDHKKLGITVLTKLNELQKDFEFMPIYTRFLKISETIFRQIK